MCNEFISYAICGEAGKSSQTFNCGNYHTFADKRDVCSKAKGQCICYFGTCGHITICCPKESVSEWAFSNIRCGPCTAREDETVEHRHGIQLIEDPQLSLAPIPEDKYPEHLATLRKIRGAEECPYHISEGIDPNEQNGELNMYDQCPDMLGVDIPLSAVSAGRQMGSQVLPTAFTVGNKENANPIDDNIDVFSLESKLTRENVARVTARFGNKVNDLAVEVSPDHIRIAAPIKPKFESNGVKIATGPETTGTKESTSRDNDNKDSAERVSLVPDYIKAWLADDY